MGRSRVLSFMSAFGGAPKSPTTASPSGQPLPQAGTSASSPQHSAGPAQDSPTPTKTRTERSASRPMSMVQAYQPPLMEVAQDTIPELQPIFTFLNGHSNKLYQEGYFLKLNDLDSHGRPIADRSWTECFAQLVGTVLSLWDAAALDAAGQDGEVAPTFINLADASIKMIETIPTRSEDVQPLQNVLSVSTAGKNRYLFHFNSLHSLTQWTAGIRLAMFEHATLQEAYTGSLIAGKGKSLNNIRVIMERTKLKTEDWTRVRFGAGTPWRRCWCVITPPDEKEYQKLQKSLKKKSAYERGTPILKGNVKFYDTKKTKKVQPIATINDAYSAYAIYPQSKPLIDQSTLVKVEGNITIHSTPETTMEGFVFVMPETHPAVSGFEMMLRWLFPLYDIFSLYGRPNRLIADTRNTQSLMFALPQERRYGFLEILDVATLIHENGSQTWTEKEWRARLKELSLARITKLESTGSRQRSRASSYRGHRNSFPSRTGTLRYDDSASIRSSPSFHHETGLPPSAPKPGSAPPGETPFQPPGRTKSSHNRSVSDIISFSTPRYRRSQNATVDNQPNYPPSRLTYEAPVSPESPPPVPPAHDVYAGGRTLQVPEHADSDGVHDRSSSESDRRLRGQVDQEIPDFRQDFPSAPPMAPVAAPPAFSHEAGAKPVKRPHVSPELRRANSRMSINTLSQLAAAGRSSSDGNVPPPAEPVASNPSEAQGGDRNILNAKTNGTMSSGDYVEDHGSRGVNDKAIAASRLSANPGNLPNAHQREISSQTIYPQQSPLSGASGELSNNVYPLLQTSTCPPLTSLEQPPVNIPYNIQHHLSPERCSQYSSVQNESFPNPPEGQRPDMNCIETKHKIARKPVPDLRPRRISEPGPPVSRSSLESLRQHVVDENALDEVDAGDSHQTYAIDSYYEGETGEGASINDNDSTGSPDYASTRNSIETKRSKASVDRPRVGVLKTVGTVEPVPDEAIMEIRAAIPTVDFGPTQIYSQGISSKPRTPASVTPSMHEKSGSTDQLTPSPRSRSRSRSPADLQLSGDRRIRHERSPSRNLVTPEPGRRTPSNHDSRRSVAWQPGATIGGGSPSGRPVITPEQFVQQRAAASRVTPVYAHGRKPSGQRTPPTVSRNPSGEWPLQQHARQASFTKDLPTRPHSRGASTVMNASGDLSVPLSAREQEHIARVTGSPLINVASNPHRHAAPGGGLIGAIEAREKEKRDMKDGVSSHLVQQAIAQRQQYNQNYQNNQQPFLNPSPQMPMPGQWPQTPGWMLSQCVGMPQQQPGQGLPQQLVPPQQAQFTSQQRQQWVSPATQRYWSATQTPSPYPQQNGRQYPSPAEPQQGAYQQQSQYKQSQQQQYGSYFGNGQSGR